MGEAGYTCGSGMGGMEMNAMIGHEGRTHFDRKSRMKLF